RRALVLRDARALARHHPELPAASRLAAVARLAQKPRGAGVVARNARARVVRGPEARAPEVVALVAPGRDERRGRGRGGLAAEALRPQVPEVHARAGIAALAALLERHQRLVVLARAPRIDAAQCAAAPRVAQVALLLAIPLVGDRALMRLVGGRQRALA